MKDRLWFYLSLRAWSAQQYVAGMFYNMSTVPWMCRRHDPAGAQHRDQRQREPPPDVEATPRNKFSSQYQCPGSRTAINTAFARADAGLARGGVCVRSIPVVSRTGGLEFSRDESHPPRGGRRRRQQEFLPRSCKPRPKQSVVSGIHHRQLLGQQPIDIRQECQLADEHPGVDVTYVTGSHNTKVGFTFQHQESLTTQEISNNGMLLTLLRGQPSSVTVWATPLHLEEINKANVGIFAQDQWTMRWLTLNWGYASTTSTRIPPHHLGPGPNVPTRNTDFAAKNTTCRTGRTRSPRFGASSTSSATDGPPSSSPPAAISRRRCSSASPAWPIPLARSAPARRELDRQQRRLPPTGERTGRGQQRELRPDRLINTRYDPGDPETRGYNWEISSSVPWSMSRVTMNVGYFRRYLGTPESHDNVLIAPEDFSQYCVTAPTDSRLPDGGGYQVCGL